MGIKLSDMALKKAKAEKAERARDGDEDGMGDVDSDWDFAVMGYVMHAGIVKDQGRYKMAYQLLKRAVMLDPNRKREVGDIMREYKREEKDLGMLRGQLSMPGSIKKRASARH